MSRRRRGPELFWVVVFLLFALAGVDLMRGRDSILIGWWNGIHQTPTDQNRSLIQRFLGGIRR